MSKPSTKSHSTRGSRLSRFSLDTSSARTMEIPDSAQPYFSFHSDLPARHPNRDCGITKWIAAKDEFAYDDTSFAPGQLYTTDANGSLFSGDLPTTSSVSWEDAMPMQNLILDQCQPFLNSEPFQLPDASGSSITGLQSVFEPLAIDPSMNLPNATYSGCNALTVGINDNSFKNDFASGPISYDSSSSIYISPPVSPELQGQSWPGLSNDYGTNGEYATHGTTNFVYPHLGGFSHQPSSPPSPPLSDGNPHAALTSSRQPLVGNHASMENSIQEGSNCEMDSTQDRHRGPESAVVGTSVTLARCNGQSSIQSSRPAQRILKPASEKPRGHDQGSQPAAASSSNHMKPKEKLEAAQPRNHHLYKALPGKDGLYRCPFSRETLCAHTPTKQKCGYE